MPEVVFYGEDICDKCGVRIQVDINGEEWAHRCSDGIFHWADGSEVKKTFKTSLYQISSGETQE